eukprot:SAG25_NODE_200_length_12050_cov_3.693247_1_plen_101_part_00
MRNAKRAASPGSKWWAAPGSWEIFYCSRYYESWAHLVEQTTSFATSGGSGLSAAVTSVCRQPGPISSVPHAEFGPGCQHAGMQECQQSYEDWLSARQKSC